MGCTSSKSEDINQAYSYYIEYEESLHMKAFDITMVLPIISRYISNNYINRSQLEFMMKELGLSTESKDLHLINSLKSTDLYNISSKKLQTLTVLISKGTINQKSKFLFEIYKKSFLEYLQEEDVKELIENIFELVIEVIPRETLRFCPQAKIDDLIKLGDKLEKIEKVSVFYFFHRFMDGRKKFDLEEFLEIFFDVGVKILLEPWKLRKFCLKFYEYFKNKEVFQEFYQETVDEKLMKSFSRKLTKIR